MTSNPCFFGGMGVESLSSMGLGDIVAFNMAFDQAALDQAAAFAQAWYDDRQAWRAETGYYGFLPGPVSVMDLSNSISSLNDAYAANNAAWFNQQQTYADLSDQWSNAMLGVSPYVDPATGADYSVANGANFYWADPYGGVWGTDLYAAPDPYTGYAELMPVF